MGHLVNPIAFRLGHYLSWEDKWFIKGIYYPEFLHAVLKTRFYLFFFFNKRSIEKTGFFYSHFEIIKMNKDFIVRIMFYHSKLEYLKNGFIFDNVINFQMYFRKIYYLRFKNEIYKFWDKNLLFSILILFLLIEFFLNKDDNKLIYSKSKKFIMNVLNCKVDNKKKIYLSKSYKKYEKQQEMLGNLKNENSSVLLMFDVISLLRIFKNLNNRYFFKLLNKFLLYNKNYILNKSKILFFFLLLKNFIKNFNKHLMFKKLNKFQIVNKWLNLLINFRYLNPYLSLLNLFLVNIIKIIINAWNIKIKMYLINNNNINAKFLARFIARKFKRKFTVKQVIKPLQRELKRLLGFGMNKNWNYMRYAYYKNKFKELNVNIFYKGLFRKFSGLISFVFSKESLFYYIQEKTFYDFQTFFFYLILNKKDYKKSYIYKKFYFKNRKFLYFFYNLNFFYFQKMFLSSFIKKIELDVSVKAYINPIYEQSVNFFLNSINLIMFKTKNIQLLDKSFIFCFYYLKNIIKYNYINFNYRILYYFNNLKKRIIMNKEFKKDKGLILGYKIALNGRFTRRQRAAHLWWMEGNLPLNTVKCKLDYAFYTVPIINSAVGIKVWLNKNENIKEWVVKLNV